MLSATPAVLLSHKGRSWRLWLAASGRMAGIAAAHCRLAEGAHCQPLEASAARYRLDPSWLVAAHPEQPLFLNTLCSMRIRDLIIPQATFNMCDLFLPSLVVAQAFHRKL